MISQKTSNIQEMYDDVYNSNLERIKATDKYHNCTELLRKKINYF